MTDGIEEKTHAFAVEISPDKMAAWLSVSDWGAACPNTIEQAIEVLNEAKVQVTADLRARIEDYAARIAGANEHARSEKFLVAQGRPAKEGGDGTFEWDEALVQVKQDWTGDAPIDYYSLSSIVTVEKDQRIGTLIPPVPGEAGKDVLGQAVPPSTSPIPVRLDPTVLAGKDDASVLFAAADGRVVYEDNRVSISEVVAIDADVDFSTGSFNSTVDVHVSGTILDNFEVTSKRGISVDGTVESATLQAEGDVVVRHGIVQTRGGSVRTSGIIVAKFADAARLHAGHDIRITRGLMNCRVHCDGKLLVGTGSVIGGELYARNGAEATVIGSSAGVVTSITVGIDPAIVVEVERIRENIKTKRQASEQIRKAVQPLMADLKRLSATQKERATELLFQADEFDAEISEAEQSCQNTLAAARAADTPYVLASHSIHAGVRIQIGRRETVFKKETKGAVRIEKRKMGNVTEFVAINGSSGAVTILSSHYVIGPDSSDSSEPVG